MIVVKILGGLGNQLFQYAIGRSLAVKNNTELGLDLNYFKKSSFRRYELHHFNIRVKEITASNFKYINWANSKNTLKKIVYNTLFITPTIYSEKTYNFDNNVLKCTEDTYLKGFWQSEKYFIDIKDEILDILDFDDFFNKKFADTIKQINDCESIALHVRRGDYLTNKNHLVLDLGYYEKAIRELTPNLKYPKIFIFSDDIEWCRLNLKINLPHQFMGINKSWQDLKLMTFCKHFIIANSSFSWWAAYLSKHPSKKVICPKAWFPERDNKNIEDIFVKDWIKI